MNSKERMLTALHKGKPDRLPVSVHQWQQYHLDVYLEASLHWRLSRNRGWTHRSSISGRGPVGRKAPWTWRKPHGQIGGTSRGSQRRSGQHRVERHRRHAEGKLTYKTAGNRLTTWITEYMIKQDEDIELIRRYMPVPALDLKPVSALYDRIGDKGILRGFVWGDQASCWQHAACLMDVQDLIMRCYDKPDWITDC